MQHITSPGFPLQSRQPFLERLSADRFIQSDGEAGDATALNVSSNRIRRVESRLRVFSYAISAISLTGAIISILAGISLLFLIHKKERVAIEKNLMNSLTTPNEKLVIQKLESSGGELTQTEIVRSTGLSRVKVHRILSRLEQLMVIKKYPFGMTNKIQLEGKSVSECENGAANSIIKK